MKKVFSKMIVVSFLAVLVTAGATASIQDQSYSKQDSKKVNVYPYVYVTNGGGSGLGNY